MANYLKQDCEEGFVEDSAMIEYLKFNNLRHTILGCMLGDFDENGHYVVSPRIISELISMKKYIVESLDNIDICQSAIKLDKRISFMVTFEMDCANLILIEKLSFNANNKLNSGKYSNIVETVLDTIETSGEIDKNIVYKRWNIEPDIGDVLDIFDMDADTIAAYFGIVNRFKYLMVANKVLLEKEHELEEIESNYALNLFEIVSHYPKLKELVDKDIKTELDGKQEFLKADKPNFAKTLNEIITQSIENNLSVLNEKEIEEFRVEQHSSQNDYNIRVGLAVEMVRESAEIEDARLVEGVDRIKLDVGSPFSVDSMTPKEAAAEMLAENKIVGKQIQDEIVDTLSHAGGTNKTKLIYKLQDDYELDLINNVSEDIKSRVKVGNNEQEDIVEENKEEAKSLIGVAASTNEKNLKNVSAAKPNVKKSQDKGVTKAKKGDSNTKKVGSDKKGSVSNGKTVARGSNGKRSFDFDDDDYYSPTDFTQGDLDSSTQTTYESPTVPHSEKPVNNAPLDEKPKTPTENASDESLNISQKQEMLRLERQIWKLCKENSGIQAFRQLNDNMQTLANDTQQLNDMIGEVVGESNDKKDDAVNEKNKQDEDVNLNTI